MSETKGDERRRLCYRVWKDVCSTLSAVHGHRLLAPSKMQDLENAIMAIEDLWCNAPLDKEKVS